MPRMPLSNHTRSPRATRRVLRRDYGFEPPGYTTPPFPSLHWPPEQAEWSLYHVYDAWRFTLIWTLILYAVFHSGAALLALAMQFRIGGRKEWAAGGGGRGRTRGDGAAAGGGGRAGGRHTARRRRSAWKYLWTIPLVYAAVAGIEAVFAGSIVGLV